MKKSCYICTHSVKVGYSECYGHTFYKEEALFCIAAPPSITTGKDFSWNNIKVGYDKLRRYKRYPVVSDVAPCSLYAKTDKENKITEYEIKLQKEKEQKQQEIKDRKNKIAKQRLQKEEEKEKREKVRKDKLKKKMRKKYQKEYKARKKAKQLEAIEAMKAKEEVETTEAVEDHGRFGFLDLRR